MAVRYCYNDGGRGHWRLRTGCDRPRWAGDCVTRALAIVTGIPYGECWDFVDCFKREREESGGRRYSTPDAGAPTGCAADLGAVYHRAPRQLPADARETHVAGVYATPRGGVYYGASHFLPTVAQAFRSGFLPKRGRVIVQTRGHAVALVDGVFHDTGPVSARTRVRGFWAFPGLSVGA